MCISSALKKIARDKSYDRETASSFGVFNESLFWEVGLEASHQSHTYCCQTNY